MPRDFEAEYGGASVAERDFEAEYGQAQPRDFEAEYASISPPAVQQPAVAQKQPARPIQPPVQPKAAPAAQGGLMAPAGAAMGNLPRPSAKEVIPQQQPTGAFAVAPAGTFDDVVPTPLGPMKRSQIAASDAAFERNRDVFTKGLVESGASFVGFAQRHAASLPDWAKAGIRAIPSIGPTTGALLDVVGSEPVKQGVETAQKYMGEIAPPQGVGEKLISAAGAMVPAIAASAATGGAGLGPVAASWAGAGVAGATAGEASYQDAYQKTYQTNIEAGVPLDEAKSRADNTARIAEAVNGVVGALAARFGGVGQAVGRWGTNFTGKVLKTLLGDTASQALFGEVQAQVENRLAQQLYDPTRPDRTLKEVTEDAIVNTLISGGFSAASLGSVKRSVVQHSLEQQGIRTDTAELVASHDDRALQQDIAAMKAHGVPDDEIHAMAQQRIQEATTAAAQGTSVAMPPLDESLRTAEMREPISGSEAEQSQAAPAEPPVGEAALRPSTPAPEPVQPHVNQPLADKISQEIKDSYGVETPLRAVDKPVERAAEADATEALAKAINKNVVWVEPAGEGVRFGGTVDDQNIYVNTKSESAYHGVLTHEVTHRIEVEAPDLHKQLTEAAAEVPEIKQAMDTIQSHYKAQGLEAPEGTRLMNEAIADALQNAGTKREFWQKMYEKAPEAVRKIVETIGKLIEQVTNARVPREIIGDLQAFHDTAAEVMAEFIARKQSPEQRTAQMREAGFEPEVAARYLKAETPEQRAQILEEQYVAEHGEAAPQLERTNAIQERSAEEVDVRKPSGNGETMGGAYSEGQEAAPAREVGSKFKPQSQLTPKQAQRIAEGGKLAKLPEKVGEQKINPALEQWRDEVRMIDTKGMSPEDLGLAGRVGKTGEGGTKWDDALERAYELGLISDEERTEPSVIGRLMSGENVTPKTLESRQRKAEREQAEAEVQRLAESGYEITKDDVKGLGPHMKDFVGMGRSARKPLVGDDGLQVYRNSDMEWRVRQGDEGSFRTLDEREDASLISELREKYRGLSEMDALREDAGDAIEPELSQAEAESRNPFSQHIKEYAIEKRGGSYVAKDFDILDVIEDAPSDLPLIPDGELPKGTMYVVIDKRSHGNAAPFYAFTPDGLVYDYERGFSGISPWRLIGKKKGFVEQPTQPPIDDSLPFSLDEPISSWAEPASPEERARKFMRRLYDAPSTTEEQRRRLSEARAMSGPVRSWSEAERTAREYVERVGMNEAVTALFSGKTGLPLDSEGALAYDIKKTLESAERDIRATDPNNTEDIAAINDEIARINFFMGNKISTERGRGLGIMRRFAETLDEQYSKFQGQLAILRKSMMESAVIDKVDDDVAELRKEAAPIREEGVKELDRLTRENKELKATLETLASTDKARKKILKESVAKDLEFLKRSPRQRESTSSSFKRSKEANDAVANFFAAKELPPSAPKMSLEAGGEMPLRAVPEDILETMISETAAWMAEGDASRLQLGEWSKWAESKWGKRVTDSYELVESVFNSGLDVLHNQVEAVRRKPSVKKSEATARKPITSEALFAWAEQGGVSDSRAEELLAMVRRQAKETQARDDLLAHGEMNGSTDEQAQAVIDAQSKIAKLSDSEKQARAKAEAEARAQAHDILYAWAKEKGMDESGLNKVLAAYDALKDVKDLGELGRWAKENADKPHGKIVVDWLPEYADSKSAEIARQITPSYIKRFIRERATTPRQAVLDYYAGKGDPRQSLYERLTRLGLPPEDTAKLIAKVDRAWGELMETEKFKALKARFGERVKRVAPEKTDLFERMMQDVRMGAMSDATFRDRVLEKYGIKSLSPEELARIEANAEAVRKARAESPNPDADPRVNEAIQVAKRYLRARMQLGWGDVTRSVLYYNWLSGFGTQAWNLTSTATLNLYEQSINYASTTSRALVKALSGDLKGAQTEAVKLALLTRALAHAPMMGISEAAYVLKTGYDPFHQRAAAEQSQNWQEGLKFFELKPSELPPSKKNLAGALKWGRRLGLHLPARALIASDTLFRLPLREQRMAIVLAETAAEKGLSGRELYRQVSREMGYGKDAAAMWRKAGEMGHKGVERAIAASAMMERFRDPAASAEADFYSADNTLNNPNPNGILGTAAKYGAMLGSKHSLAWPFTRFLRIGANVANKYMEYFPPTGYLRALRGKKTTPSQGMKSDAEPMTAREREWTAWRATMGLLTAGAKFALAYAAYQKWNEQDDEQKQKSEPDHMMSGWGPADADLRKAMQSQGWRPFSSRFGDGKFESFATSPTFISDVMWGSFMDNLRWGKKDKNGEPDLKDWNVRVAVAMDMIASGMLESGQALEQNSIFTGVDQVSDIIRHDFRGGDEPASEAVKFAAKQVRMLIPGSARDIANIFDPLQYKADDLTDYFVAGIPVVRGLVMYPDLNIMGDPIPKTGMERFGTLEGKDPEMRFIINNDKVPRPPQRDKLYNASSTSDEMTLATELEYHKLVEDTGKSFRKNLKELIPHISSLPKEQRQAYIMAAYGMARHEAEANLIERRDERAK